MMLAVFISIVMSTLRTSTPLILGAIGGLFSERSGVINIAAEGFMLFGAFIAAAITIATGSPWLGLLACIILGSILGFIYGFAAIILKANQIVLGTAFNLLALGLIPLILKYLYGSTGSSPSIPIESRFQFEPILIAWAIALSAIFIFKYLPLGLWIGFAGENPEALTTSGIRLNRVRLLSTTVSGAICGLGGASLSIYLSSGYSRNMVAGRGFISLAALIFGGWMPSRTLIACLLFGFMEAIEIVLQQQNLFPPQIIQLAPYLITMFVLAGFVGQNRAPSAIGR